MIADKKKTADKSKIDKIITLPKVKSKAAESKKQKLTSDKRRESKAEKGIEFSQMKFKCNPNEMQM